MRWSRLAFALIGCLTTLALLYYLKTERTEPPTLPAGSADHQRRADSSLSAASRLIQDAAKERKPINEEDGIVLRGRVRSAEGTPISGARVEWIILQKEDTEPTPSWPLGGWGVPRRDSIVTETNPDGFFSFIESAASAMQFGSALVALHENYFPGGQDLQVDPKEWPSDVQIILTQGTAISVEVVDSTGHCVPGATVRQSARARERSGDADVVSRYEHFLAQETITDARGAARLAPFPGEKAVWAMKGDRVSVPWQGVGRAQIVLTLGTGFTVGGSLSLPDWSAWDPEYAGERRILVSGLTGSMWRSLVQLRDVEEGNWGPVPVPLGGIARYAIRLEGLPITPQEVTFDPPAAGSHRHVAFAAEKQEELWFLVQDESERPISTAEAVVWWGGSDMHGPNRVEGASRPDGTLYTGTFPAGRIEYRISAPGYAAFESWDEVPRPDGVLVSLERGGQISGRCVHAGKPVPDFQVVYWKAGPVRLHRNQSFFGREDGQFEIDGLETGSWSIYAASPSFPSGPPITVTVEARRSTEVEIELPTAVPGGGRVIAADTGEPVPDARIQPFLSGGVERGLRWGLPVPAHTDGSFELKAFVLGSNYIRVDANGYASADVTANALNQEFLDWGDIRLLRAQALQVDLLGIGELQGLRPADMRAYTAEGHILPETRFAEDGTVRFDNVPPGDHRLLVSYPDGNWDRIHLRLDAGEEWRFDHKIAGDRRLVVRVVDAEQEPLSPAPMVMVTAQESRGVLVLRLRIASDLGYASFEGIRSDRAQAIVMDQDGSTLANEDLSFGSSSRLETEIKIGDKPFRIHVIDVEESPVPAAWVTIRSSDGVEIHGVEMTDSAGWASLVGVPRGPVLLDVSHGIAGRRLGVPIVVSSDELEFVLEAEGILELRLVDGEEPLAGVLARIETTGGVTLSDAKQTDGQGRVRFEPLGQGAYRLACRRADCWSAVVERSLGGGEHALVEVQMRRLADLELRVFNRDGLPVAGVEVELVSAEFGVPVETWIHDEKLRAPHGLATDALGVLRLEGLPHGEYRWSLPVDEELATGSFELEPGSNDDLAIQVPL